MNSPALPSLTSAASPEQREPLASPADITAAKTLELLWARIRQQGDMPGFARAIGAILGSLRDDDEAIDLTQTVLSDPVLTQKVLRLANSGMYSAFGRSVNTVSKAVLVLGSEAICHLALGLKLIEELSNASPNTVSAHIEMEKALLAGTVGQHLAAAVRRGHVEEAAVCSMLHTLGRMMVAFYLPDCWARLQAGFGQQEAAAREVLGMTLGELGEATARQWGFPQNLINGMRTVVPAADGETENDGEWMAALSTMAARCADALWHDEDDYGAQVAQLAQDYSEILGVDPEKLLTAIDHARKAAAAELTLAPLSRPLERAVRLRASASKRAAGNRILTAGIAAMRNAAATATPAELVSMALESMHAGLEFSRAMAFSRRRAEQRYVARLSLGRSQDALPALQFDDSYEPNVFHAALNSDRVIFIDNAADPKFSSRLPQWWKGSLSDARSFLVLPLTANGQPTGFIYGDWVGQGAPAALDQAEFGLLNDMRELIARAIESRRMPEQTAARIG
jgi:HD-like signal output (HDOD) protein